MTQFYQPKPGIVPLTTGSLGIPNAQERYAIRKRIIAKKLNTTLLPAMRRHGIDMWLVMSREFHHDPFLEEIGGGSAGVRNAYIFFDNGGDVPEKVFIGSHGQREDLYATVYDQVLFYGYSQEGLAPHLREAVHQRDPKRIGINMSPTLPMADGLSATLKQYLEEAIGPHYSGRLVSAELVARDFRDERLPEEFGVYRRMCEWTVAWCTQALSRRVIHPGVTTCADVHWWMRDKAAELGFGMGFLPGLRITRQGQPLPMNSPDHPILPGDIVTLDVGLTLDLYTTDYQRAAYVLRHGETEPPHGLQQAYQEAIRVRDRLTANMLPGEIAHKVWEKTMAWAESEGYEIMYPATSGRREAASARRVGIWCHSIGTSHHGIGARIAVDWPMAYGDRVRYPLELNRWYSVELGVSVPVPEWDGRAVSLGLEDTAALTERGVEFFIEPETQLLEIGP